VDGFAGIYPCHNVDFIEHLPPAEYGGGNTNEVWGWTDPLDQTEYVLLGKTTGVAFISIADPLNPIYLGTLPPHTSNSTWRTLRTYSNYLFIGSEANGHGLQVFDLTRLRDVDSPPAAFTEDAWYGGFGRCHTLVIEEQSGMLYACGTNTFGGGLHIVDITNPLEPVLAGAYDQDGYTHEAQVVVYDGPDTDYAGHVIVFCYNGNNTADLTIVDATDPLDATTVSITPYPQSAYCHQGWLTPDKRFLLMDDELDEFNGIFQATRTLIWNVEDLDNPVFMDNFMGTTPAIDHNQIIMGNLSYQSNYTAGLRLIDVSDIENANLSEVGYFDHYVANNNPTFNGQWMSYPFFESGVVPLTDISGGLFLVEVNFTRLSTDVLYGCADGEMAVDMTVSEGFTGPITFEAAGLPAGVNASFSQQGIPAPGIVTLTLSNLENAPTSFEVDVIAQGGFFTYSRIVQCVINPFLTWYEDVDGDGYGVENASILACDQPLGYASESGDCAPDNPTIHPNADGTGDEVDNNCNGTIDESESGFCADVNGDGVVTVVDVLLINAGLGCLQDCPADLNDDGLVSVIDLLLVIADFGDICD